MGKGSEILRESKDFLVTRSTASWSGIQRKMTVIEVDMQKYEDALNDWVG